MSNTIVEELGISAGMRGEASPAPASEELKPAVPAPGMDCHAANAARSLEIPSRSELSFTSATPDVNCVPRSPDFVRPEFRNDGGTDGVVESERINGLPRRDFVAPRKDGGDLRAELEKVMKDENLSQKEIAKKINYSQAAVNTYLNGKYEGNLIEFETVLKGLLNHIKNRNSQKRIRLEFVPTSIAAKLYNIARICHLNSEIGLCTGSSGVGKTTAITEYAKHNSGVIVIDPDENITPRTLLRLIGTPLKLKLTNNMSCQEYSEMLVNRLKDSEMLIIIDEAENISADCFRVLRKIHDRCDFTCGLLFVGTERLAANLARMQGEFSYVTNRLGFIETLDGLTLPDAQKLIKQIFPNCPKDAETAFYNASKKNARILFNLLKRTADIAGGVNEGTPAEIAAGSATPRKDGGAITVKMINSALKRIVL